MGAIVQIDVEHLDRFVATMVHDVQLDAAVGPQPHVDAVRPEFQRVEIGLLDESFGVQGRSRAVREDLVARSVATLTAYSRPRGAVGPVIPDVSTHSPPGATARSSALTGPEM